MSDSTENLDKAQKNQKRVGAAGSDPETTGPADNLLEEAAQAVDKRKARQNPHNFLQNLLFEDLKVWNQV